MPRPGGLGTTWHALDSDLVSEFIFYSIPVAGTEVPLIVAWLIAGGVFFTFYLGFINLRGFKHALHLVSGRYTDPSQPGEVTPFQALATAVSGTVGIGNIAGVAVAISMGGPGATMWLIIAGLLGMNASTFAAESKVLVFGGTGRLGAPIVSLLVGAGHPVTPAGSKTF